MFEPVTQPSRIALGMANICARILLKRGDDNADHEIQHDESENPSQFTWCTNIEETHFDHQREFLLVGQVCPNETVWTVWVPLQKSYRHTVTGIAPTPHPDSKYPARAMAPPLIKCQKWTLNTLHKSDLVPAQTLPLSKSSGNWNSPWPNADGVHNVPELCKATFEEATRFMEAIMFTQTLWRMISNEKWLMVHET